MTDALKFFHASPEVAHARQHNLPIVALESTVITHGLPRPQNMELAMNMEKAVLAEGSTPATIALLDGKVHVGIDAGQLEKLVEAENPIKVSLRDFATALVQHRPGGTTVAGTMYAAQQMGIKVFATGGIGGVHKEAELDISTDLQSLATIPMIVVCAGAKSILNLPATLEYLETMGVPVVGYGTDRFPEFFSRGKNLPVSVSLNSPDEVVKFAHTHWNLGMKSAVLVCQPLPEDVAIPAEEIAPILQQVSEEVRQMQVEHSITGQQVTPYELMRVNQLSGGRSMKANLQLLTNNATLASKIAHSMSNMENRQRIL